MSDILSLQEDTGNSQAANEEVTIISSDSEPLPKQKIRRVTRKVRFSHPLAYQDPQFLLEQQQFESRRQTRTSKDAELSSGLPNTPRKRRNEVTSILTKFTPWRVSSVNHSIPLTRIIMILPLPPASHCNPICRVSRLYQGIINHSLFVVIVIFLLLY